METIEAGQLVAGKGDYVGVMTWMKAELAPAFQVEAAAWVQALCGASAADGYFPPFDSRHGPKDAWDLPFWADPDDRPAARWILNDLNNGQRRILASLGANPVEGAWTKPLLLECGFPGKASGTFRALGGRFRRCDRRPMWNGGEKGSKGQRLSVKEPNALAVFTAVLLEDYPELAAEVGLV